MRFNKWLISKLCEHEDSYTVAFRRGTMERLYYCPVCKKFSIYHKGINLQTPFGSNVNIDDGTWDKVDFPDILHKYEINDIEEFSDGYHTFKSLYEQRCVLFAALVNAYSNYSWKSERHEDGERCFGGGWFIVGIDTPAGTYTYHYKMEEWDKFNCKELEKGKEWDGHTDKDVSRLLTLM